MRAKTRLGPGVWATLQAQAGVISRSQLAELGVGRRVQDRLAAEGTARVVTTGVLSFGGDPGWFGRAWAGLLVGGPEAVLGLDSAGHLHGLIREPPDEITVFVGRRRWPTARPGYRFIRALRAPGHTEPARTGVEATLLDLCAAADEDEVAALLADAVRVRPHPRPSDPQLCERRDGGRQVYRVSTRELVPNVLRQSSIRGHRGDASIHTPVDNRL